MSKSSGLLSLLEGIIPNMPNAVTKMYDTLKAKGFDVQELKRIEKYVGDMVEQKITFEQFIANIGIKDSKKVVALTSELLRLREVSEESEEDFKAKKDSKLVNINEPETDDDFSDLNVDAEVAKDDGEEEPDEFTKSILAVMKHADDADDKFDPEQLAMGVKVEKEHFDNTFLAKAVAKAHLAEFGDYYTRLKRMEDEARTDSSTEAGQADQAASVETKTEGE